MATIFGMLSAKSLINIKNSKGPRMGPYDMPMFISLIDDETSLMPTTFS